MNLIDAYLTETLLYANIVGMYYNKYDIKKLKAGSFILLIKEPDNAYDCDAIRVMDSRFEKIGYLADSIFTVGSGCFMASDFKRKFGYSTFGKVVSVEDDSILVLVKTFNHPGS